MKDKKLYGFWSDTQFFYNEEYFVYEDINNNLVNITCVENSPEIKNTFFKDKKLIGELKNFIKKKDLVSR